jgi:branched-chain amino acid transport system permease protein
MLGMLGGVLGALFINKWGLNAVLGFVLVLACGAVLGLVTEVLTVRPVLKSIEQHLYVLSTLAFALMVQQVTAVEWGTEAQPFPVLIPIDTTSPSSSIWGIVDQKFWLPVLACIVTIGGLEFLYRRTLVGRAFLAIAEDSYAARALGLPETQLRLASFALAGVIGTLAGFTGAQMLLAFFGNQSILNFYGFVPVALGGMGSNRGAVIGGLALGLFQQAANFLVGGIFAAVAVFAVFIVVLLLRPEGLAGGAAARRV